MATGTPPGPGHSAALKWKHLGARLATCLYLQVRRNGNAWTDKYHHGTQRSPTAPGSMGFPQGHVHQELWGGVESGDSHLFASPSWSREGLVIPGKWTQMHGRGCRQETRRRQQHLWGVSPRRTWDPETPALQIRQSDPMAVHTEEGGGFLDVSDPAQRGHGFGVWSVVPTSSVPLGQEPARAQAASWLFLGF